MILLYSFEGISSKRNSGDSCEDTPVPMPNTEVKLTNAESTWLEAAREDRKLLIKKEALREIWVLFCMGNFLSERGTRDAKSQLLKERRDAQKVVV